MKTAFKKITPFISIVFFVLAIWFLDQELRQYNLGQIIEQLSEIPNSYIALSVFFSFLSYVILTGYDGLGVRYIGEDLSTGRIVRAGFIGYAFSHNIGMALVTGGSIRYRIYSSWGFSGIKVTQIVGFSALTLWLGFCTVAGLSLVFATPELPENVAIPFDSLRIVGLLLLVMVAGYLVASTLLKEELTIKNWSFSFPDLSLALKQVVLASIDWIIAAMVLYVLLPETEINFYSFIGVFLLAQIIGLFSQVPGGLGVFESVMLLYLSNFMQGPAILGTLLVYRIIYYILPLLVAVVVLAYQEYLTNKRKVRVISQKAVNWIPRVVPHVLSVSVFIGGSILLFSGSMPSEVPRMEWLQVILPLPVIEMSHFFASLVGVGLMVLARSLQRRIEGAYHFTVGLLIFGIIFTLMRGADYEEASILAFMLLVLVPCRGEFHRKTSVMTKGFSPGWVMMISLVFISAIWLGIFSYRNVAYQEDLWWQFTLLGDAPRYLRAMVGVLSFTLIISLMKLLKPKKKLVREPKEYELEKAKDILKQEPRAKPNIVQLGDKELMFSTDNNGFIMYAPESRSMVAMGDPVGPESEVEDLIWNFQDYCEEQDLWPVFYQVREDYLEWYVDLGLTLMKIGEEARVSLTDFEIEENGRRYGDLYDHHKKYRGSDYSFRVIPPEETRAHMANFHAISNRWIEAKGADELGFSQGIFNEEYLSNFPIAAIFKDGEAVAFSNIWEGANYYELSFDLLRNNPETPDEIIDYLLIEMILWGKAEGYEWFSLGMAPLSGMKDHQHSKRWSKVADWVYTYGENFYNFREVRTYREKFNPEWEPRYLAVPGGWALPGVLKDITNLISGGIKGFL
ncbi:bifunctional lysylphosphatidylglycerol flippase/synthetase MprF [Balneolaceae bacterium YR4-1]|uniref:Phosphatidylglycerol lysyltransferase n=1 Tax=Halalkalibaculum roseum TaxID=2709311 RepID=A0A6M1SUY9_9BACT|nr:bifunctional lysylphosphatidylglycerol flippase/synthetase MprF [Halalkalibaculum roseum]NGP76632.1 bifunctional lysylphosphatidylglycerol flippase/synthetase MprF [Halalkalibaculum roseum]